jgi:hypothetical protein
MFEKDFLFFFSLVYFIVLFYRQPTHRGWAFNADRGEEILKIWNKIPNNTDVLITHGPPIGETDVEIF